VCVDGAEALPRSRSSDAPTFAWCLAARETLGREVRSGRQLGQPLAYALARLIELTEFVLARVPYGVFAQLVDAEKFDHEVMSTTQDFPSGKGFKGRHARLL
jgi:hypothetical protein